MSTIKKLDLGSLLGHLTGLDISVHESADTNGRELERGGSWDPIGVMIHHTASDNQSDSYVDFLAVRGRPQEGIPAPLCNFAVRSDGSVIVTSIGRSNHAGAGDPKILKLVKDGRVPIDREIVKPASRGASGNEHFFGIEVMYSGSAPMTPEQRASTIKLTTGLCRFLGVEASAVIGHREWTGRKVDPGNEKMDDIRRDVQDILEGKIVDSVDVEKLVNRLSWVLRRLGVLSGDLSLSQQLVKLTTGEAEYSPVTYDIPRKTGDIKEIMAWVDLISVAVGGSVNSPSLSAELEGLRPKDVNIAELHRIGAYLQSL